jgi:TolB-like protein/DNA-binding winged helix-turn-helix (wHTH) protein
MPAANGTVRFGVFEVDLRAGELRRRGVRVKLQEQPFQVLALLLERPGQVVTREELQARLWQKDTFVDFEQGLNGAIKRLRQALRDSAESPRFVETVPRRGYRFIAPTVPGPAGGAGGARRRRVRGIAVLSAVAALVGAAVGLATLVHRHRDRGDDGLPAIQSVAVLPLKNLSGDPAQEYFADGLTEALITELARIESLKVISRTSVMRFKETRKPLPDVAEDLGVEAVLEGSVLRAGSRVRVTAQLIDARTDRHIWGESYEREVAGILDVQAELARNVASAISERTTPLQGEAGPRVSRKVAPRAYELYLKGRHFIALWGDDGDNAFFEKGIKHLRLSTDLDPGFAPAWAALATGHGSWGFFGVLPPGETGEQAKAAAQTAIGLDPTVGEAYAALGITELWHDWDWVGSEAHVRRALQLSPNSVPVLIQANFTLLHLGHLDEAVALNRRAVELDPLTTSTNINLVYTLLYARRYSEALAQVEHSRRLDPSSPWPWIETAWVQARRGQMEAAVTAARRGRALLRDAVPSDGMGILGWAFATAGHPDEARDLLRRIEGPHSPAWTDPYYVAYIYAALGDQEAAFERMDRALREHSPSMVRLLVDPTWSAATRASLRYADLCRRVRMPQPLVEQATVGAFTAPTPALY